MYAKLRAGLDGIRDRAIFLIACFCALRPSELFGLTWGCYGGNVFTIVNTAWRGRLQRKKIKRKNRDGRTNYRLVAIPQPVHHVIDLWRAKCPNPDANALMFPEVQARARKPLATPIRPDNWLRLRLYPVAKELGIAFHPTFQGLRRNLSTHGNKEARPTEMQAQLGYSNIRTTLDIYTQITEPEVARMVNQVTNRILGLGENGGPGSVQ
jgi:integrase